MKKIIKYRWVGSSDTKKATLGSYTLMRDKLFGVDREVCSLEIDEAIRLLRMFKMTPKMNRRLTDDDKKHADEFTALVLARIGLAREMLHCPREQSDMTPCLARDGRLVLTTVKGAAACVGCGANLDELLVKEREKHIGLGGCG